MAKGVELPFPLRAHLSPRISVCSPTRSSLSPAPLGFYGGFITQTRLIKSLATDGQFNLRPLSPPRHSPDENEHPNPVMTGWVPLATSPHFDGLGHFKSHFVNITKATSISLTTKEIPRVLEASC